MYIENAYATPPHLDVFCILEAQAICLVSVVFDRWVAHYNVWDYRFVARFWLIFHVWRTRLGSFGHCGGHLGKPWDLTCGLRGTSCEK